MRFIEQAAASGRITLTAQETLIFDTCRATVLHSGLSTTVRVAGGWVRDKVLGLPSDDIDIVLDDQLGREFAARVNDFLTAQGAVVSSIGVILAQPDQSKHLETATFKIHGLAVDMCNLRAETYADDSRIPAMTLGTPAQDASRRDITINALFYNLNTDTIEDFCGMALDDLAQGLIRTPAAPLQTFLDDPLRVLRAVRFAGRFGFALDAGLCDAASSTLVREQLLRKVTRERFGQELDKMFKTVGNPVDSFRLFCDFGLFPVLFALPEHFAVDAAPPPIALLPAPLAALTANELATACIALMTTAHLPLAVAAASPATAKILHLAAFLAPLHGHRFTAVSDKRAGSGANQLPFFVLRHSLRLPLSVAESVTLFLQHAQSFVELSADWLQVSCAVRMNAAALPPVIKSADSVSFDAPSGPAVLLDIPPPALRLALGHVMRSAGDEWGAVLGLADVLARHSHGLPVARLLPSRVLHAWLVGASGLVGCWARPVHFGGRALMEHFKVAGPRVGEAMAVQVDWMLLHPDRDANDCRSFLATVCALLIARKGAAEFEVRDLLLSSA